MLHTGLSRIRTAAVVFAASGTAWLAGCTSTPSPIKDPEVKLEKKLGEKLPRGYTMLVPATESIEAGWLMRYNGGVLLDVAVPCTQAQQQAGECPVLTRDGAAELVQSKTYSSGEIGGEFKGVNLGPLATLEASAQYASAKEYILETDRTYASTYNDQFFRENALQVTDHYIDTLESYALGEDESIFFVTSTIRGDFQMSVIDESAGDVAAAAKVVGRGGSFRVAGEGKAEETFGNADGSLVFMFATWDGDRDPLLRLARAMRASKQAAIQAEIDANTVPVRTLNATLKTITVGLAEQGGMADVGVSVETAVGESVESQGWTVRPVAPPASTARDDIQAALQQADAEVLIYLTSETRPQGTSMVEVAGSVSVYDASGRSLGRGRFSERNGDFVSTNSRAEAERLRAERAADEIESNFADLLRPLLDETLAVVEVSGTQGDDEAETVRRIIESVPSVTRADRLAPGPDGSARILIEYNGGWSTATTEIKAVVPPDSSGLNTSGGGA